MKNSAINSKGTINFLTFFVLLMSGKGCRQQRTDSWLYYEALSNRRFCEGETHLGVMHHPFPLISCQIILSVKL